MIEQLSIWPDGVIPETISDEDVDILNEQISEALEEAHRKRQQRKRKYNKTLPPHLRIIGKNLGE